MESLHQFLTVVYGLLPDFSGILLAAVGAAMIFAPNWIDKVSPPWRWAIAASLAILGLLGMRSSYTQHRDADQSQKALKGEIHNLNDTVVQVKTKLEWIIQHPASEQQKQQAIILRRELPPTPILDPSMQLLQDAQAWQRQLHGFYEEFDHEWTQSESDIEKRDEEHKVPPESTRKEILSFRGDIEAAYRVRYLRDYAQRSNDLHMKLIGEVPLAARERVDYLNPFSYRTNSGQIAMSISAMQEYDEDFTGLVSALEIKLQKTRPQ
jgi:hypothetical protein